MGQIPSARIRPLWLEQVRAGGQIRTEANSRERAGGHELRRHILINDLVHKAGIRAVFQQPAYKIGQQVFVRADGGVDSATGLFGIQHEGMQRLAHAMQSLEFKVIRASAHLSGDIQHRRHAMRIMRGKLRIDAVCHAQQLAGIADIADVGVLFGGEYRKTVDAFDLCTLDFRVPIGTLYKADHDLAVKARSQIMQVIDDQGRALAIGLHHHAKAVPPGKRGFGQDRLDDIQRQ